MGPAERCIKFHRVGKLSGHFPRNTHHFIKLTGLSQRRSSWWLVLFILTLAFYVFVSAI